MSGIPTDFNEPAAARARTALEDWIHVGHTVRTPDVINEMGRAYDHLVPTTGREADAVAEYFADPGVVRRINTQDDAWSNVIEAFGQLVRYEVTAERQLTAGDAYFCVGVVALFLAGSAQVDGFTGHEESVAHAMAGLGYYCMGTGNEAFRLRVALALRRWPDAFCLDYRHISWAARNRFPRMLGALLFQLDRLPARLVAASALRLCRMLERDFDFPLYDAMAMVMALIRRA